MNLTYTNMLATLNIGSAHPGGLTATKKAWQKIKHFPIQTILDAGCGTGQTLKYLSDVSDSRLIGIDNHPAMIEQAKKRLKHKQIELILGDLQTIPLVEESVDCVFSESVSSFSEIDSLLGEFQRILRPGGLLHLIEIATVDLLTDDEQSNMNHFYGTKHVLTKSGWLDQIDNNQFEIMDMTILPATTTGKVDIEWDTDIDQIYFDFLSQHFQTIEQLKDKLVGIQIICQKEEDKGIRNVHSID